MAAVTCSRRWPDGCWAHSPARIDHECEVNPSLDEVENVCNACTNTLDQPHPQQEPCRDEIWSANAFQPDVDEKKGVISSFTGRTLVFALGTNDAGARSACEFDVTRVLPGLSFVVF